MSEDNQPIDLNFNIKIKDDTSTDADINDQKKIEFNSVPEAHQKLENSNNNENQQSDSDFNIRAAAHPVICIATFAFKLAAIIFYFLLNMIISNSICSFVIILLLTCIDFWSVKNITGRFLVGLRWWSEQGPQDKEIWRFETHPSNWEPNKVDQTIFWFSQIIAALFFAIMFILKAITLDFFWGTLCFICCLLYSVNLWGFYQCRGEHQKKAKQYMANMGMRVVANVF